MVVNGIADKIRSICARLLHAPANSAEEAQYRSELRSAAAELERQQKEWNKPPEGDKHRDEARHSYRSREKDSADGFAEGLKLFNSRKQQSEKKKD